MKNINKNLTRVLATFAIIILNFGFFGVTQAASANTLVEMANSSRVSENLNTLTVNEKLSSAAQAKATDMFKNQYFAHIAPSGKTPWDFINAANYKYSYAGENLSIGFTNDAELHNAWLNSPTHRANIMGANYNEIGIAIASGMYQGSETTIVVQMFGKSVPDLTANLVQVESAQISPQNQVIIKEETGINPTNIFLGEKLKLKVTLNTEAQSAFIQTDSQKIDLTGADLVFPDNKRVYEKMIELDKPGDKIVNLTVKDTNGNSETFNLGKVTVLPRVLVSQSTVSNHTGLGYLSLSLISASILVILAGLGYSIYNYQKKHSLA